MHVPDVETVAERYATIGQQPEDLGVAIRDAHDSPPLARENGAEVRAWRLDHSPITGGDRVTMRIGARVAELGRDYLAQLW